MKNEKSKIKNLLTNFLAINAFAVLFWACDAQIDSFSRTETIDFQTAEGESFRLSLKSNKIQPLHNFNSWQEVYDFMNEMEARGDQLIINKQIFEDLKHYHDPYFMAILDNNYSIEVGEFIHRVDKVGEYRRLKGSQEWELLLYYGESGMEDLKEYEFIVSNSDNLEAIKNHEFKNIGSILFLEAVRSNDISSGRIENFSSPHTFEPSPSNPLSPNSGYWFSYRPYFNGPIYYARIRYKCWNTAYKSGGSTLARGGTWAEIDFFDGLGFRHVEGNWQLGAYHENNTDNTVFPQVGLRLTTRKKRDAEMETSQNWKIERGSFPRNWNGGVDSEHVFNYVMNNDNNIRIGVLTTNPVMVY